MKALKCSSQVWCASHRKREEDTSGACNKEREIEKHSSVWNAIKMSFIKVSGGDMSEWDFWIKFNDFLFLSLSVFSTHMEECTRF